MNWDLNMSWTRKIRTQTQIQEHKPKNFLKNKNKNTKSPSSSSTKSRPQASPSSTNPPSTTSSPTRATLTPSLPKAMAPECSSAMKTTPSFWTGETTSTTTLSLSLVETHLAGPTSLKTTKKSWRATAMKWRIWLKSSWVWSLRVLGSKGHT